MATAKQIAARKLFTARAKAGTLRKKQSTRKNPATKTAARSLRWYEERGATAGYLYGIGETGKADKITAEASEHMNDQRASYWDRGYESGANQAARELARKKNPSRGGNDAIHIDIDSHNTGGRNVRAKNPRKSLTAQKVVIDKNPEFVYLVQKWHTLAGEWINLAGFDHLEDAEHFAKQKIKTSATQIRVVDQYV